MFVELIGGLIAGSLAIMTDAAHMLSDVSGFVVSILALHLSEQDATLEYSYGFQQAEIIGALFSIMIVWALTAVLVYEAVNRCVHLQDLPLCCGNVCREPSATQRAESKFRF